LSKQVSSFFAVVVEAVGLGDAVEDVRLVETDEMVVVESSSSAVQT
jgi:hypothetical protein